MTPGNPAVSIGIHIDIPIGECYNLYKIILPKGATEL